MFANDAVLFDEIMEDPQRLLRKQLRILLGRQENEDQKQQFVDEVEALGMLQGAMDSLGATSACVHLVAQGVHAAARKHSVRREERDRGNPLPCVRPGPVGMPAPAGGRRGRRTRGIRIVYNSLAVSQRKGTELPLPPAGKIRKK